MCDGASTNLALFKVLAGYRGIQLPQMEFANPFDPDEDNKVFLLICPSHQVCYFKFPTKRSN